MSGCRPSKRRSARPQRGGGGTRAAKAPEDSKPPPSEEKPPEAAIKIHPDAQSYMLPFAPGLSLEELMLAPEVAAAAGEILQDARAAARLKQYGFKPARTLLMYGPPGNGKTSLAVALARALKLPGVLLRAGGMKDMHVGNSEKNLIGAFAVAMAQPCVLFMDEADSLLSARTAVRHSADKAANDLLNTILTTLDRCPEHVYVFAATNLPDNLDPAALRRFELHIELPLPEAAALQAWYERFVAARCAEWPPSLDPAEVGRAAASRGESYATFEQRCVRALRGHVRDLPASDLDARLRAALLGDFR
jgi:SpoVK/Ycf46/Vps4 family AAA+-type ATPase